MIKMYNKDQLQKLVKVLSDCNDISKENFIIVSNNIKTDVLDELSITYRKLNNDIHIDLDDQNCKIYKTKQNLITYFNYKSSSVAVIEDELIFIKEVTTPILFENLIFSKKIQELMIIKKIISYHDGSNKKFLFLSEHIGKVEVGYKEKSLKFFNGKYDLSDLYKKLVNKFNESEYLSFFLDNFIKIAKEIDNVDDRFYETLIKIKRIIDNSNREFELYKHNFSFEKFYSNLQKEKEKYIKHIQENLLKFLSKVNTLPIQFGVYILLVFRFQNEIIPLIATIILIISWSAFSLFTLTTMRKTINFFEKQFNNELKKISKESGLDKKNFTQIKEEITNQILNTKNLIFWYKIIVVIFSLVFIAFSSSNIYETFLANIRC